MKLALVIERYDPRGGGAERSTHQIARELAGRGHAVTVLARRVDVAVEEVDADGIHVLPCPRAASGGGGGAVGLRAFSRWATGEIDRGGFGSSLSVTTAVAAAVVQPRSGTIRETLDRNVALRRGAAARALKRLTVALSPKHRALLALERRTLTDPRVRRIAAVSRYVADQLARHYGVPESRVEVIPNAAAMPSVTPEQRLEWRTRVRAAFGVPDGEPAYLFAAHNPRLKGIDTLLDALAILRRRGAPGVALLAGPPRYAIQARAARLGVRERVRVVGPTDRMAALYCAADVTVLPTFYDPSSKVVIESLMLGVPAISTAYNGASDLIDPSRVNAPGTLRGRVIADPSDATALAGAMAALADADERARCAAACAGLAEELSMRRHVDALERVLVAAAE